MAPYIVAAALVLCVAGLLSVFRSDPRETRARDALAVGVFEQTRDVDRVQLSVDETARVLDTMEEIEFRKADGGALRSDLACGRIEAWRSLQKVRFDVCVLLEPDSGQLLGSFDRIGSSPALVGSNCKGVAVTHQVRCRAG